ncbi:hypothetical protein EZV62_004005 [Acer yangbiense]|uniref:Bulb-type lectin domain-containing protein n=1 Tax=Acer yangbiense TaxID=1000413 RepID=A0A5C7IIG6_9ROSI|nr:hypothetical protein EZV62_004005 [Acer yangbiense]
MLWQSLDYPSDTLLPGMKLGINLKAGHKWFLQSWLTDDSPALGRYTVGMDPNVTNQLTIWWQGEIEGTSGHLLNGKFNSWDASGYNFSYNSNDQEKYFSYSVSEDITAFPMVKVGWDGSLVDDSSLPITPCSVFDEYCGSDEIFRMCNSIYSSFHSSFGMMSGDGTTENDTGCEIWSRGSEFIESNDGNSREIYVKSEDPGFAEEKWWIGLVIAAAVALALLVILLCSLSYLARRKYKRKEEKRWQSLMADFCYLAGRKLMAEGLS